MGKYVLLKLGSVLVATFSQILLKKSANKKYDSKIKEYLNFLVIFGYGMFFISSIMSVFALKGMSISTSSIMESLSYIIIPILSYFFLQERINKTQLAGMIVIIIGVIIFNL